MVRRQPCVRAVTELERLCPTATPGRRALDYRFLDERRPAAWLRGARRPIRRLPRRAPSACPSGSSRARRRSTTVPARSRSGRRPRRAGRGWTTTGFGGTGGQSVAAPRSKFPAARRTRWFRRARRRRTTSACRGRRKAARSSYVPEGETVPLRLLSLVTAGGRCVGGLVHRVVRLEPRAERPTHGCKRGGEPGKRGVIACPDGMAQP